MQNNIGVTLEEPIDAKPEQERSAKRRQCSRSLITPQNYPSSALDLFTFEEIEGLGEQILNIYDDFFEFSMSCHYVESTIRYFDAYLKRELIVKKFNDSKYSNLILSVRKIAADIDHTILYDENMREIDTASLKNIADSSNFIEKKILYKPEKNKAYNAFSMEKKSSFIKAKYLIHISEKGLKTLKKIKEEINSIIDRHEDEFLSGCVNDYHFIGKFGGDYCSFLKKESEEEKLAKEGFKKIKDFIAPLSDKVRRCEALFLKLKINFLLYQAKKDILKRHALYRNLINLYIKSEIDDSKKNKYFKYFLLATQKKYIEQQNNLLRQSFEKYNDSLLVYEKNSVQKLRLLEEILERNIQNTPKFYVEEDKQSFIDWKIENANQYISKQIQCLENLSSQYLESLSSSFDGNQSQNENELKLIENEIIPSSKLILAFWKNFLDGQTQFLHELKNHPAVKSVASNPVNQFFRPVGYVLQFIKANKNSYR